MHDAQCTMHNAVWTALVRPRGAGGRVVSHMWDIGGMGSRTVLLLTLAVRAIAASGQ